jgi:predicted amidohydrolase
MNIARDHHYAPQFYLRNFAVDPERKKITTVAKNGTFAVWAERSIEGLGYARDFYVHLQAGVPVSVEEVINERIETPISQSDTWAKIVSGRTDALDRSDKAVLYALIRHLEARTPHYRATADELATLAASNKSDIPFTPEEQRMYVLFRETPEIANAQLNAMASSLAWTGAGFRGAGLSIFRSPLPLRSSTIPVMVSRPPAHPALRLPLPGMVPYMLNLTLNRNTIASLVLGDFDDAFTNTEIAVEHALGFNRHFVAHFAFFEQVRHLITDRDDLAADMTWAPYELIKNTDKKIVFRRRTDSSGDPRRALAAKAATMAVEIRVQRSSLMPGPDGVVKVRLIQTRSGADLLGRRSKLQGPQSAREVRPVDIQVAMAQLEKTEPGILNVVSFHRGMRGCVARLEDLSNSRTVVTLAGVEGDRNLTFIACDGQIVKQAKISLASEDTEDGVKVRGSELNVFLPADGSEALRWAVLNCHDYTNADLLLRLLEKRIELIVVVTINNATDLYWEYAVADVHRLFCYVVIVNVAELGGSGLFAPFRRIGCEKNATFRAGGRIFAARGPGAEISAPLDLKIGELRWLRREFADGGLAKLDKGSLARGYSAMVPAEHYMHTFDRGIGPPPIGPIKEIPLQRKFDKIRVAVGQLESMCVKAYVDSRYRIENHADYKDFKKRLNIHLNGLARRCRAMGKTEAGTYLDLLVLPEVFVPRSFAKRKLRNLARDLGAIIVCGVDYPGERDEDNANECAIIRPGERTKYYRKVTRSQYDAKSQSGRMHMSRGETLYRFVNERGHSFGILICYDFSHLDLITKLNCNDGDPLDVLVVVAHNPFGQLYRTCCIADSHRFYQFVVMCNIAKYGGSGIYAPVRTEGARQTILDSGKGAESIAIAELDLAELRHARSKTDVELNEEASRKQDKGKLSWMRKPGLFQR